VGRSLWREGGSVVCQTQSAVIRLLSVCTIYMLQVIKCMYTTYTRPLSVQAQYSRSCTIVSSSCYNSSLVTWTVVCLTAAKFKPLIFPVSRFALSNGANICIFMIWIRSYLHGCFYSLVVSMENVCCLSVDTETRSVPSRSPGIHISIETFVNFAATLWFSRVFVSM
jgi:hypothetical protein